MANTLPVAVPLATHGYGRPAIYYGNYDPSTHPGGQTGEMLNLAEGSLFIQYGELSLACVETCVTKIWMKDCTSDCDTAVWVQLAFGGSGGATTNAATFNATTQVLTTTVNGVPATVNILSLLNKVGPTATIKRTSKIGLRVVFNAEADALVAANAPLTYAWSGAGLTFATATAQSTVATVTTPGEYTVNLVVTDADGQTSASTAIVKLDRIIDIGGADREISDYFSTLTAAIAWRDANAAGQYYRFHIVADTSEPGVIANLDNADVTWSDRSISTFASSSGFTWTSITPVKVSLRAVSQRGLRFPCIIAGGNYGIRLSSVVADNVDFTNLSVRCLTAGSTTVGAVSVVSSTNARFTSCSWGNQVSGVGPERMGEFLSNFNVVLDRCQAGGSGTGFYVSNSSGSMIDCYSELYNTVLPNVAAALQIPILDFTVTTTTFDVTGGRFISNVLGTSTPGLIRCAIHLSSVVGNSITGLTMMGVTANNRTSGGTSIASVPANAAVSAVRMVGCSGIGAFTNITPVAGTAAGQNHTIPN